jgi:hypothetical protein
LTHQAAQNRILQSDQTPYLSVIPLVVISFVTIAYSLAQLKWKSTWLSKWTEPFIKEEPLSDEEELLSEKKRPSVLWPITLAILALGAIALQLFKLRKLGGLQLDAIFFLSAWSQVLLILILNRSRYCPAWLLAFYFSCITIDVSSIQSWTHPRDIDVAVHYGSTIVNFISLFVILIMPFRPISPASGPISVVGTPPSSNDRSPEDSLRLWQFLTTSWVWPLLAIAKKRQLEKEDIWKLGYGFQNGRVIAAFREVESSSLFWRLLKANGLDCGILVLTALIQLACGV